MGGDFNSVSSHSERKEGAVAVSQILKLMSLEFISSANLVDVPIFGRNSLGSALIVSQRVY